MHESSIVIPSKLHVPISVIFVTFNSADTIRAALASVQRHMPEAEVIVADNGSTDETCRLVSEVPSVRLLRGQNNVGFGAGVNSAAQIASGELLLILNPDATVLHADVRRLAALPRPIGIRGCLISDGYEKQRYLLHPEWGWRRELCWAMLQWFVVPHEMTVRRPHGFRAHRRPWVSGAAFVVDRIEFRNIGGFDEAMFLYFEDMDLSRRYRLNGAVVATTDAVVFTHCGQGSSRGNQAQIQAWALMSLIELVAKRSTGHRDAARVARSALRLLSLIATTGRYLGRLPVIGRRAQSKRVEAELVRSKLLASVDAPPVDTVYAQARAAIATQS
jgi:N-acetylglucosaminyl-diphospho-decaprenol L-rhamnosyltransferase